MIHRTGKTIILVKMFVLMAAWLFSSCALASLSVMVDRTEISDADLLKLTLLVRDTTTATNPDFRALEKDFEIVQRSGPNQSSKISIINGRQSSEVTVSWELRLRPRKLGTLTIPAFRIGSDTSAPISIRVTQQSQAMKQKMSQLVFFDTEVDTNETYVQGQILYTIKLHYVENISGDFPPLPNIPDTVVEVIEGERRYDAITNGRRYYVLEKRYGVYPQKSGELTIPAQTFSGFRVGPGFFSTREPVLTRSEAHTINVKAKPDSFTGDHWLPAANVSIEETWIGGTPDFTVGEPINRSIMIAASGVAASLLPPLDDTPIEGAKTYQDPPVEEQALTASGINSIQTVIVGIVPTRAGNLELPAIEIPWWNTRTDQLEVARIPAQTFKVKASSKNSQVIPPSQQNTMPEMVAPSTDVSRVEHTYWQYASLGLLCLWLLTLLLWFVQTRRKSVSVPEEKAVEQPDLSSTLKALKSACQKNDATMVQLLLIRWGSLKYTNIHSLQALVATVNDAQLQTEINQLEANLYAADGSGSWQGQALWSAIQAIEKRKDSKEKKNPLTPALNPTA